MLLLASIAIEAVDGELINELVKTLNLYGLEHLLTVFFCTSNIKDTVLPWLTQLTSGKLDSVHDNIVPPYRLQDRDGGPQ